MFTKTAALVGALLAGFSQASPVHELAPRGRAAEFPLKSSWAQETLYKGFAASGLSLDVSLPQASVEGLIKVDVASSFLKDQTIRVDLSGLEANFAVNLVASAAVSESFQLVASEQLSLGVPGLLEAQIGAGFALDLVLSVSAAIDVSAGVHIKFPIGAYVEVDIATKKTVQQELTGLIASVYDIGLGVGVELTAAVELGVALRLRSEIIIGAGVELLGIQVGAGVDVQVWIDLFDYTTVLVQTGACTTVSVREVLAFVVGVAVEIDVVVPGLLELYLAPSVVLSIKLAGGLDVEVCLPTWPPIGGGHGGSGSGGNGGSGSGGNGGSGSGGNGSNNGTDTGSHGGNGSGYSSASPTEGGDYTTTTVYQTTTYTATSCAAEIKNCPATYTQQVTTVVTTSSVYVCPATETAYPTSTPSTYKPVPPPTSVTTITLTTCPAPETTTYTPAPGCPTPVPTTTITEEYPTETPTYAPQPPPHSASNSYPASTPSYGANPPPSSYPVGGPSPSYPVGTGGYKPVPPPTGGYPVVTPKPTGYPTGGYPTPPVQAGAGRVLGSSLAAAVAMVAALML